MADMLPSPPPPPPPLVVTAVFVAVVVADAVFMLLFYVVRLSPSQFYCVKATPPLLVREFLFDIYSEHARQDV